MRELHQHDDDDGTQQKNDDGDDPKVTANLAVADFHRGGREDPRRLLVTLLRAQALADAQSPHRDVGGDDGDDDDDNAAGEESGGGGDGGGVGTSVSEVTQDDRGYDTFVLRLNIAYALQELAQFARSVTILQQLFDSLEAVDDPVALRVCALLTRVRMRWKPTPRKGFEGRGQLTIISRFVKVLRMCNLSCEVNTLRSGVGGDGARRGGGGGYCTRRAFLRAHHQRRRRRGRGWRRWRRR